MQKIEFVESKKNIIIIFGILFFIGFALRLFFTPFHIPINLDGIDYFAYSVAMSRDGAFPIGYLLTNFGWPSFVSIFFMFNQNSDMLTLMNIQRILSIVVSVSTIIPIYFLTKIFFKKEVALLASTLFLFDPRIIENSILGISDTLLILLSILTILFIFYKKGSWIYVSFICVALSAFVRYEGLLLIIPLIVSYLLKSKHVNFSKSKLTISIFLFLIIIIPINFINFENSGQTSIFSQLLNRGDFISETIIGNEPDLDDKFFATTENHVQIFIKNSIEGFVKYTSWTLFPIFIIFCILGIIFIPKKITKNKIIFGLFFVFLALTSIFAYGRGFQETRYVLILIPFFVLLSCYGLNFLIKYDLKKIIPMIIFIVIISSFIFIELRNIDFEYESEMYNSALFLTDVASGINDYTGNKYVKVAELQNNWPELLPKGENSKIKMTMKKFKIDGFNDPVEYIKFNKNMGLTHLLIVEGEEFFDDIFVNEKKYLFLEKIYDSKDFDTTIKYKIFKINYEILNE